jgi:hypothetical protein
MMDSDPSRKPQFFTNAERTELRLYAADRRRNSKVNMGVDQSLN